MNTQKMVVILASMALAALAGLVWLAMVGNVWAVVIVSVMGTTVLIVIGYGLAVWQQAQAAAREQAAFMANAKENLAMMATMQTVQNRQSAGLMAQLNSAARLPAHAAPDSLMIEDGIFSELEG